MIRGMALVVTSTRTSSKDNGKMARCMALVEFSSQNVNTSANLSSACFMVKEEPCNLMELYKKEIGCKGCLWDDQILYLTNSSFI